MINAPEDLASKKRYTEAGRVLLDYAGDEREAVIALVQGNQFSEARRIVSQTGYLLSQSHNSIPQLGLFQITLHECPGLLEEIINPAVLEARSQIAEDLTEMREQLQKQVARLRELRIKKVEEPGTTTAPAVSAASMIPKSTDCILFFRTRGVLWHRRPRGAQRGRDDRCLGLHRLHAVHHGADHIRRIAHDEAQLALEAQDGAQSGLGAQRHGRRRGVPAQIAHKARGQARHRTRYALRDRTFLPCCSPLAKSF